MLLARVGWGESSNPIDGLRRNVWGIVSMTEYRRAWVPGGTWFFTVNLAERHVDYIHWNPVKHGYVRSPADWPCSSFHDYLRRRLYQDGWGGGDLEGMKTGE